MVTVDRFEARQPRRRSMRWFGPAAVFAGATRPPATPPRS
jgi:hypothetical protein